MLCLNHKERERKENAAHKENTNMKKHMEDIHMKDYEITIKKASEVTIFATDNDTLVFPSKVTFESSHNAAEILIDGLENTTIGIPPQADHIELSVENATVNLKGISYSRIEIDGKGKLRINTDTLSGNIDINMISGEAELIVPADAKFSTRSEGKNNTINCPVPTDPNAQVTIELNGKNSTLSIRS